MRGRPEAELRQLAQLAPPLIKPNGGSLACFHFPEKEAKQVILASGLEESPAPPLPPPKHLKRNRRHRRPIWRLRD